MTVIELGHILMGEKPDPDTGVYLVKDETGDVIYVGSSKRISYRLRIDHQRDNSPLWQEIIDNIPTSLHWDIRVVEIDSSGDLTSYRMRLKESDLIKYHMPRLNSYLQPEPSLR